MRVTTILLVTSIFLASCGGNGEKAPEQDDQKQTSVSADDIQAHLDTIKELDKKLITVNLNGTKKAASDLYNCAQRFVNKYPDHEKTPLVLELVAKSAEAKGSFEEAINVLHKLITEFPETELTPRYMRHKATILETKMNKVPNAKAALEALIERFPNSPEAEEAKLYIENYLGKSDTEIIQFLNDKNAE